MPHCLLTKQKLNTQSSTESELVGVDDMMPTILWTQYFLEAQGYAVRDNIVFQDNRSVILLSKNGKSSSTKQMKHINIWYFFITDRMNKGEVSMEWCLIGSMIMDYMTKPLQGSLFWKMRDIIIGIKSHEKKHNNESGPIIVWHKSSVPQECVGRWMLSIGYYIVQLDITR